MRVVIFYDNEMYIERWKCIMDTLVEQDLFTVNFTSLFDTNPNYMEDSFFSVFLLTPQQAASMPLIENVKALLKAGAHEKSMLFIINDKDQVSLKEREVITTEVHKTIEQFIVDPEILWTSIHGYHLYQTFKTNHEAGELKTELRYTYWDPSGEPRTLQDMVNNQEMPLVIEDSGIPVFFNIIEQQMLLFPQRANRKDPSKQHVMLIGGNRLVSDVLAEQESVVIHKVDNINQVEQEAVLNDYVLLVTSHEQVGQIDYARLNRFSSVTVLIDGGDQRNAWEVDQDEVSGLTVKYPTIKFLTICSFYIECLKLKKTRNELIDDPFIVIRDQYGFPVIKEDVSDWEEALFLESRIKDVIKVIS